MVCSHSQWSEAAVSAAETRSSGADAAALLAANYITVPAGAARLSLFEASF